MSSVVWSEPVRPGWHPRLQDLALPQAWRTFSPVGTNATRWEELLDQASRLLPEFRTATAGLEHESKGIRRSELFFFYAFASPRRPARILESGRARAQSTLVLARLFPDVPIISLESDAHSADAEIGLERLRSYPQVDCRFGDSVRLLPELVRPGDVVLIDGPKDLRALKLAFHLLQRNQPQAVFVHDLWPGSPAREFVDGAVPSTLLSDEPRWVEHYAALDFRHKRRPAIPSKAGCAYGPTLGCFEAELENYARHRTQCRVAQGVNRLRSIARQIQKQPPPRRPRDFEPVR